MDWRDHLRAHGYAHFPRLVPEPLVDAALEAIGRDLVENYDPPRQLEYDNRSYCPDLLGNSCVRPVTLYSSTINSGTRRP
jgi:hypothetical protein